MSEMVASAHDPTGGMHGMESTGLDTLSYVCRREATARQRVGG